MRVLKYVFFILTTFFLIQNTFATTFPNGWESIEIEGYRLGMTLDEAKELNPDIRISNINHKTKFMTVSNFDYKSRQKKPKEKIQISFRSGKAYHIRYNNSYDGLNCDQVNLDIERDYTNGFLRYRNNKITYNDDKMRHIYTHRITASCIENKGTFIRHELRLTGRVAKRTFDGD